MNIQTKTNRFSVILMAFALSGSITFAADLVWTGAASADSTSAKWNHTDVNWKDATSGEANAFTDKDSVTFNDTSLICDVIIENDNGNPKPDSVVVDTEKTYTLKNNNTDHYLMGVNGLYKRGSGKLVLTTQGEWYMPHTLGAKGLQVEGGEVQFLKRYMLKGYYNDANGRIDVASGATLRFSKIGVWINAITAPVLVPLTVAKGGKFIVEDSAGQHGLLGPMTFNDGDAFDYSCVKGYSKNSQWSSKYLGMMTFSGKITLRGENTSYEWTTDKMTEEYRGYSHVSLWDGDGTEFDVSNTTGDGEVDFTLGLQLDDRVIVNGSETSPGKLVKSGSGTMALINTENTFTGDIEVRGGVLQVGPSDHHFSTTSQKYLGSYVTSGRKLTVGSGAMLYLPNRGCFGATGGITNNSVSLAMVFDGGVFTNYDGQGFLLPDVTFRNGGGIAPGSGSNGNGRFMVTENFRVEGSVPFVWDVTDPTKLGAEALALNGYPRNVFTIADVTGDTEPDATFNVPFIICNGFFRYDTATGNHQLSDWAFGFTKRGEGTMRYTAAKYLSTNKDNPSGYSWTVYNGNTDVEEGTLQMDGDITFSDTVNVAGGAFLSGTGKVNKVVLAAGAGFKAPAGQKNTLRIEGELTISENPVVEIDLPVGASVESVDARILSAAGAVVGVENLVHATVKVNGVATDDVGLRFANGELRAKFRKGLCILLR